MYLYLVHKNLVLVFIIHSDKPLAAENKHVITNTNLNNYNLNLINKNLLDNKSHFLSLTLMIKVNKSQDANPLTLWMLSDKEQNLNYYYY